MDNNNNNKKNNSNGRNIMRKGAWTEEEDRLLRNCIQKYGEGKWHQVPHRAGLNRCRKSCRLRWLNYLRPNIKRGNFDSDEIDLIIRLHKLLGNKWSLIAGRLPGRTANDVKNYWNTHMKKHKKEVNANSSVNINDSSSNTTQAAAAARGGPTGCGKMTTTAAATSSSSSDHKVEKKTITTTTIVKPLPLSFSKNSPWFMSRKNPNTINSTTSTAAAAGGGGRVVADDQYPPEVIINDQVAPKQVSVQLLSSSSLPLSQIKQQQEEEERNCNHDNMQWLENLLLNDKDDDNNIIDNNHINNFDEFEEDIIRISNMWFEEEA